MHHRMVRNMNSVLECINSRTSVRSYLPDDVPENDVKEILNAGFHAANGLNTQTLRFVVVQNVEKIEQYSDLAKELYKRNVKQTGNSHPTLDEMVDDVELNLFYSAPVAIFVFADDGAATPVEDGSLAIGNMMIAAHSMGYGTCWIGLAAGLGYYPSFRNDNNVPKICEYIGCIALGKPEVEEIHPRNEIKILNWIR